MARLNLQLSAAAKTDLDDIFDYTRENFGQAQAVKYFQNMNIVFQSICDNPRLGRTRHEVRQNLRRVVHEHHVVFYRIDGDVVKVLRVLHDSRDVDRVFD